MSEESSKLAMTKTILASVGSVVATAVFARSIIRDYLPRECEDYLTAGIQRCFSRFSNEFTLVIEEYDKLNNNEIFEAAEIYLSDVVVIDSSTTRRRLKISKSVMEKSFYVRMEKDEEVVDVFNGVKLRWIPFNLNNNNNNNNNESDDPPRRSFFGFHVSRKEPCYHLIFHRKYTDMVMKLYLPFLLEQAKLKKQAKKTRKLFTPDPYKLRYGTNIKEAWMDTTLDHPARFNTLALDPELKDMILKDLDRFLKRRDYYRKVGKAWKRGYLLYGPPGTGKSTLIASMANYLNFDIYDLDLSVVRENFELRKLLMATANKSILVVEDIDCTVELKERSANSQEHRRRQDQSQMTLSGFLNFIDGLWSSCGDERVIIFTTNHKDKLDPALLRPGRMDVHIHISYCTPSGFRILAINYLGLEDHPLFDEIEELIETIEVTPAEVAEQLLHHDEAEVEATLKGLIGFLHKKQQKKIEEANAKKEDKEVNAAAAGEEEANIVKGVDDGVNSEAEEKEVVI